LWTSLIGCRTATPSLPRPARAVTDAAGILSPDDISALERDLASLKSRDLAEMIIYIVPSLPQGANLEELTLRSVNSWGVGRRGAGDGLAIFVFLADHKIRIEVGRGLEGAISDQSAARIIAENMAPAFVLDAYGEGLRSAVQEVSRLLEAKTEH
jgi:uncharacterized protein